MISTLMLIALGFLAASLLSLLIMPYIWRHAVKATARRLQFASPDSVVEVRADRDQLRAEHALSMRKLELRIKELKERLSADAVDQTRSSALIDQLRTELMERDTALAERQNEITELRASMSPMETELATRTGTVQQLRDTIRQLEERVREQSSLFEQVIETAGLAEADIEALRAAIPERERKGPPLPMELAEVHAALVQRLGAFAADAPALEDQRKKLERRRQTLLKLKDKLANSRTISAREAKDYQTRIVELDEERTRLAAAFETARKAAAALHRDVGSLDTTWQLKLNPYHEMREKIDAAADMIDQSAAALRNQADVRSMLAAIPGGRIEGHDNVYAFDNGGEVFGVADEPEPPAATDEDAGAGAPPADKKKARAARVLSLAERIRALQSDIN